MMAIPALTAWLRSNPRQAPWLWSLLTFLPFVISPWHLSAAPYATPYWSGYVKGWEITALDAVALSILLGTRARWPRLYLITPFLLYIFVVLLAVFQAKFGALAFSYVFQLVRVFILFLAAHRVAASPEGEYALLRGLILGLCVQAGYALWAKAGGALQTGGSLGHQNLLGFVSHMALMPALALFLSGRSSRLAFAGVVAGLIAVILTASRATIAFSAVGLVLTLLGCISLGFTARKAMVGAVGALVLLASIPLANATLEQRFAVQRTSFLEEDREREAFEEAALAMLAAKPMGVGPNHYVFIANTEGYSARAGVSWAFGSRSTNVHNSYLLVAAETGYLGLTAFLGLIGTALAYAFHTAIRYRRQAGSERLIGLGCGILALSLHAIFEWMFVVFPAQYLFAATLGLIAGRRSFYVMAAKSTPAKGRSGAMLQNSLQRPDSAAEAGERPAPATL
jgi:O-antigen ligase